MLAIYKRELKSYFQSFIGLLFIAVTLFFVSLYFFICNLYSGYPYLAYALSSVMILFLISVPVLTMRILAEERKNKTDQLILTAPVSVGAIVMGKFLALVTILAIPTAVICTYPLIMATFGTVPMAECYLAILAFFLYGMASIAVGLFISAQTESQVIAAVVGFIVLFAGYMMSSLCGLISDTGNIITMILGLFDMETPFAEMMGGTLNLASVVYFFCLTGLVLFLTVQSIQKRRYSTSVKNISLSAYSTAGIAMVVAVIIAINLVVSEMPSTWTNIDLTSNKLYSLTEQSKDFVKTIDRDVTIYVLIGEDNQDPTLGQTLSRYKDLSSHIKVEYVDPAVNPKFYTKYTDSTSMNSLIVESDLRYKVVDYGDIYAMEYSLNYSTYSYDTTVTGYDGEGQITSALAYVLSEDTPKLYYIEGHGENELSSTFTDAIKKENVEYESINLMTVDAVPENAAGIFINAPSGDFSEDDRDKVLDYLKAGGKVLFVASTENYSTMPNISQILSYMGMSIADGLVVEQDRNYYYRNNYYLIPEIVYSTYTADVYDSYYVFTPYVKGIQLDANADESISLTSFLNTSSQSYSNLGEINLEKTSKTANDIDGPFSVGVVSEREIDDATTATLVAYGCSQIFSDSANSMVSGANQMVFGATISTFAEHEVSVSIPVKEYEIAYLTVTESSALFWGLITIIILPLGCLIAGFVIWFRRRKR